MAKTPESFYKACVGKSIDYDGAYGVQCVDAFRVLCDYLGIPSKPTPNNWADGYWIYRDSLGYGKYFDYITDYKKLQSGDVVIWKRGSASHPSSHVAMAYKTSAVSSLQEFGQNQGTFRGFTLKSTNFSDMLGALRPKQWAKADDLSKYTDQQLADMVLQGKFGNGDDRKKALGSRYSAVQAIIDARYAKKTDKYAPKLPFTQSNTNSIVNAHRYDFDYSTFQAYIKKAGGYAAYVRSLGGVFTKWSGRNITLTPDYQAKTIREFQEACDYVFGLMTMYGFNYNKGKPGTNKQWGKGADDAFYPKTADYDKLGLLVYENGHKTTIDLICAGTTKAGMTTNCGWSVTYCLRKAGLIPADAENVEVEFYGNASYHKYYRNRGAKILEPKNTADLRVGDVLGFFGSGSGFTYKHCAICVAVDKSKGTYTLYDGGSARFIKTRGCNVVGKLGDSPLYGSYVSWKVLRLKEITSLLDLKYDKAKAGAYKVTSDAFKMRDGAGTDKKVLCSLAKGTLFTTDGDYLTDKEGRVWLYGTAKSGKVSYKGFCCAKSYLKKV